MQGAFAICHLSPCPALQYFSTLSYKLQDFLEKITEHKMYILISTTTFVWNISYSKNNRMSYDQTYIGLYVK